MSKQEVQKIQANSDGHGEVRESVLRTTASYIITTEFCERLAYYGVAVLSNFKQRLIDMYVCLQGLLVLWSSSLRLSLT